MSNVLIAVMQLLVAAAFVSIPLVRNRYGARAMARAEAELARQGVRTTVLTENGMRFDAGGHETWAPGGIAAIMTALAGLNLAAVSWAGTATWVLQSLVLLGNCVILYSQLTAVTSVQAAFARKGDPELARIDVPVLLKAAEAGFPAWTWTLQNVRHIVVFGASIAALAVLALT
ncbi:hypothetical protein GCM10010156_70570 [Planobispora rosea]|uniref:Uncharacterized protein n=1 Tax=Planobispora rosea TaxID=35762 RepID=A0A8J3WH93_PLARO|nr:hypothetical protein [Planobispora rosea]GGT02476.1 hypothetical protein GCM10010156_70570 [Planobispora rosea]GIH88532.1 hypothetical protein Pro02_69400 [Planobispora rosea]